MMKNRFTQRRKSQSGNIFFMLFASVALVGAFGVGASNVMKGLVSSMSDVTRKTIAEEKMMSGGRLAIQNATTAVDSGDCDADGFVEPLPFVVTTGPHPAGGGLLPANIGATEKDPWGTPYGYCSWDPGPAQDNAGCGTAGARLNGSTSANAPVVAVISAGKDRKFSSTCSPLSSGGGVAQDCSGLGAFHYNDPVSGHCYYRGAGPRLYWDQSRDACAAEGAHLVVFETAAEQNMLWANGFNDGGEYWIGISDSAVEGSWQYSFGQYAGSVFWSGGAKGAGGALVPPYTYEAWYANESADGTAESYAIWNYGGRGNNWTDVPDTWSFDYICEKGDSGSGGGSVIRADGSDDIVMEYSYNDASGLSGDDLWRVQDTNPDTAMIQKDIEIAGNASMEGVLELRNRGLLLPDDTETGPCAALNESELRVNTTASPPVLEICYDTVWEPISMGDSGGGGAPGECGENWQLEPGGLSGDYRGADVTYGNGLYVAVGSTGVKTSPDGITWTVRTIPAGMMDPTSVVFGGGRFVATGHDWGTWSTMTSTDGITWTAGNSTETGMVNVAYGNGMFVAIGFTGNIISSPNGTNWTLRSATANDWRDVIYADGKFVVIGAPPAGNVATSTDGITWTIQAGTGTPYTRLAYGQGRFVASLNSNMAYSADGINWSGSSLGSGDWSRLVYTTTGKFITTHYSNGDLAVSDDGMAWTIEPNQLDNTKNWVGIIEGNNKLIATATDGTIYSSFCDSQPIVTPDVTEPVLPDPLVHLKLDEQTGTSVFDRMNRVTATLTGATSPPSVTGMIGRAYDLDGTDDRISIAANTAINSLRQFTLSFWTYGVNSGSFQYLADSRNAGSNGFRLVKNDITNYLTLTIGNTGNFTTNEAVPNNTWSHVALVYDALNLTQPPVIYINGVAATYSASNLPTTYPLPAGNWSIGSNVAGSTAWNPGRFDDVRIYGQLLSAEQIELLFNDRASNTYMAPNPVAIIGAGKYRGKITSGGDASCGIKEDSSLWCWGYSANGNLGNGTTGVNAVSPVRVIPSSASPENAFTQVSMGAIASGSSDHGCGIKADRTMMCWGADDYGQLGNGAVTVGDQSNPVVVSGSQLWTQVSAGAEHICAIDSAGGLWCWGRDNYGQLGNGGAGNQTAPLAVTEAGPWVSVAAGMSSTCAIKVDGSLWCWGRQASGILGNGLTADANIQDPVPVLEPGPWVKAARPNGHMCAVKLDGTAWCWGASASGKLGIGSGFSGAYPKPQRVSDIGPWLDIEVGQEGDHSCGIKYDGTAWCWGSDISDKLGNGAPNSNQPSPVRVLDPGPWASITLGTDITCGLKADGGAWCWGRDASGQLGNGSTLTGTQTTPTRVENFPNVAPFAFNDAQTLLTKNTAATTISLGQDGGRLGFDGNSGGFGFTGSGRSILANPNGNSGLSIEAFGSFDSQISWKTVTGATTRSIGVDNVTGNLEFGNNVAAVTNFMSAITPQMVITNSGRFGVGTETPVVKLDIVGGGLRIGDDTRTCTLSRRGVLRYNTNVMQYCNGTAWTSF